MCKDLGPDRKLVPGSILKIPKINWDQNKQRRQLFGYSTAAKRYALYTKTDNDIQIVEPKAHGLGYFYTPKDSPEGWRQETPQWIFEALGLDHARRSWIEAQNTCMVRPSGDEAANA